MSPDMMIKIFFSAFISLMLSWMIYSRHDEEDHLEAGIPEKQRYLPWISGALLPAFMLCCVILDMMIEDMQHGLDLFLSMSFSIFLHISLYFIVLIFLLPYLRKYISARACAVCWLIPNYLYITVQSFMKVDQPWLVMKSSTTWLRVGVGIWLLGMIIIFLWKVIEHLYFRHHILKNAYVVRDEKILEIWQQEIQDAGIKKPKFQLMISPHVSSPLTIGLFKRTSKVVLPEVNYTAESLRLIFRHEMIHISQEDSWSKFFLMFCSAICWFNPLMWIAMHKSAEDIELSCDESVLLGADQVTRQQYAHLLLSTAGDERGFTTCLSAKASSMRYRLKAITKPQKKHSGALVIGILFFILSMSCGYVALAYDHDVGKVRLFQNQSLQQWSLSSIQSYDHHYVCQDEDAFKEYLGQLDMYHLTGNYAFDTNQRKWTCIFDTPEGVMGVILLDHGIKIVPLYEESTSSFYYVPQGIDWPYLDTMIEEVSDF